MPSLTPADRTGLIEALVAICVGWDPSRYSVLAKSIDDHLGRGYVAESMPVGGTAREYCTAVLGACLKHHDGLDALLGGLALVAGEDDPDVVAFGAARQRVRPLAVLSTAFRRELDELLQGVAAPRNLPVLLAFAVGEGAMPAVDYDLVSAVEDLDGRVSPRPLLRLVEAVAAGLDPLDGECGQLRAWSDQAARELDLPAGWLDGVRGELAREDRVCVLVRLSPDAARRDLFHVAVWRWASGRYHQLRVGQYGSYGSGRLEDPAVMREVADRVAGCLTAHVTASVGSGPPPLIEVMLPCRLLNEPVERWPASGRAGAASGGDRTEPGSGGVELGVQFPVVVRVSERYDEVAAQTLAKRRHRWQRLAAASRYDPQEICWHDHDGAPSSGDWTCLAWTSSGAGGADPPFAGLLASDASAALWHRDPSRTRRRPALEDVLRGRPVSSLPDIVHQQRRAASRSWRDDHAGRDVVLFWDDPHRPPPAWPVLSAPVP